MGSAGHCILYKGPDICTKNKPQLAIRGIPKHLIPGPATGPTAFTESRRPEPLRGRAPGPYAKNSQGIPEAHRGLHTKLVLESSQGRCCVLCPVTPCRTSETVLEEHADNRSHSKATIREFCIQPFRFQLRVISGKQRGLEAGLPGDRAVLAVAVGVLTVKAIGHNLGPTSSRDLRDCCKAIRDVRKFQAHGWREVSWEFACDFRGYVAHGREHANATMLDLRLPPSLEDSSVSVTREAQGVPEAHRGLHTKFVLESSQGRCCVLCPVTPRRTSETVLEEHADNRSHSKTTIREFCIQPFRFQLRVVSGKQ